MQPNRALLHLSLAVFGLLATTASVVSTPEVDAEEACALRPEFRTLSERLGGATGACLAPESFDRAFGVATQPTTTGLFVWFSAGKVATFTDGNTTWTSTWQGLSKSTLPTARFAWTEPEPAADAAPDSPPEGRGTAAEVSFGPMLVAGAAESDPSTRSEPKPLPIPSGVSERQKRFILTAGEAARVSQRETGVPASVTIAQAILESSWGKSRLSSEFNNYFGIKAKERPGSAGVAWFDTWEVVDGADEIQHEPFRAYKTAADSFVDHGRFIQRNRRYAAALAVRNDPRQFAREINKAGYATDPDYADKLIELMDQFNLYVYNLS